MIIRTWSGSTYELDTDGKRIRRLEGAHEPLPRQGPDGEWKAYKALCHAPLPGFGLMIVWRVDSDGVGETILRTTCTSPIVQIVDEASMN